MQESIRFDIISIVPAIFESVFNTSIIKIAQQKGIAKIYTHDLHKYSKDPHGHVDDYPYGGGAGMLIKCEPMFDCIEALKAERNYDEVIFFCPDGKMLTQTDSNEISMMRNVMIICGHYKGIDQRIRDVHITREISIGDFVLSGGEIPAMVLVDSVVRLLPKVLGDSASALDDSFMDGILEAPQYTRPANFRDMEVPKELLSGNPKTISEWQQKKAVEKTQLLRPDLLDD